MKVAHALVNASLAAVLAAICGGRAMAAGGKIASLDELRLERKRLAHRKRRIIFNNDGNEPVYYLDEATEKAFLACRTTPLLGSQVDSIFYCTWSSGFGLFTHDTKVGEVFTTTANPKHPKNTRGGFSKNKTAAFIKQGTDPLKMMVAFCKKHGIEAFWSFRMNDTHDAWGGWYSPYLFPHLKKDHPEWLVASAKKRSRHGGWSAMDFNHKEVRDLAVRFVEEVCESYDVDGIEMDFFRHAVYFKGPAWGKDASQAELDKLTSMVREVRQATERIGLRRGRPILVAVRVPDSVAYSRAMGIDVERWMKEGLIDLMAVTGYFRLSHWDVSVKLGGRYGVPVYACLSETRMRDGEARKARASLACYRGRATNAWAAGAAGVYLFNAFNPRSPLWRQLGEPKTLATMDKLYTTGARGVGVVSRWMANGERRFLKRSVLSPERPAALTPGKTTTIRLRVGEKVGTLADKKLSPEVKLRLRVKGLPSPRDLAVAANGTALAEGKGSGRYVDYAIRPTLVRKGENRFDVTLKPASTAKPTLQDLLLWVRYKPSR